jgi:hypothetical protein
MHSYFDPRDVWEVTERVSREREAEFDLWVVFNDRRRKFAAADAMSGGPLPTRDEVLAAMLDTDFAWTRKWDNFDATVNLTLNKVPDTLEFSMHADTVYVSPSDLEGACRGLESLIVEAAFDPQTPTLVHSVAGRLGPGAAQAGQGEPAEVDRDQAHYQSDDGAGPSVAGAVAAGGVSEMHHAQDHAGQPQ